MNRLGSTNTSEPLELAFLELYQSPPARWIVTTLWVVEHLDVIEDISPGILPGWVNLAANPFSLISWKKLSANAISWHLPRRLMMLTRL